MDSGCPHTSSRIVQVPADLSKINLASIREALAVAQADDKKKGKGRPVVTTAAPTGEQLATAERRGYELGYREGMESAAAKLRAGIGTLFETFQPASVLLASSSVGNTAPLKLHRANQGQPVERFTTSPTAADPPRAVKDDPQQHTGQPELRILRVLAARQPARFTRAEWAVLARMKKTSGTWQTYLSRLRVAGYLDEKDGRFGVTPAGLAALGRVERPVPGSVVQQWQEALGSGPNKILTVVVGIYPKGIHRANLADQVGMTQTSGTFQTYLSKLKSNGLIEVKNREIVASSILFLDAAA